MEFIDNYYTILKEELQSWAEAAVAGLPDAAVALIVVLFFALLSRYVSRAAYRLFHHYSDSEAIASIGKTIVKIIVFGIGIVIALGILGLQKAVFSLLAGAGILGLALGFAFQDLAANFIAGLFMAFRKPFRVGDIVESNDFMGSVSKINMRNTIIETFDGQLVVMPNKMVFENPLINYSATGARRIGLQVGVGYESDLENAKSVISSTIENLSFIDKDKGIIVYSHTFGDSSINFTIYYWIKFPGDTSFLDATHAGISAVHKALNDADINIPFPIRTIDLSNASETLKEVSNAAA